MSSHDGVSKEDWLLLILTFFTGVAIGMYVYVTVFKTTYQPDSLLSSEEEAAEFSVIGKVYGGRLDPEYIRPSFRVTGSGKYTYLPGGTSDEALEPINGTLPSSLLRSLKKAVTATDLSVASRLVANKDCRSYVDGNDYEYDVVLNNVEYELDTCDTNLDYNSDLALVLQDVWDYFSDPSNYSGGSVSNFSFYDYAEEFIRKNLSPYEE